MDFDIFVIVKATGHKTWISLDDFSPDLFEKVDDEEPDLDPVWADSDALASAGWGTDEDYGG